jgi:hypothetical protein
MPRLVERPGPAGALLATSVCLVLWSLARAVAIDPGSPIIPTADPPAAPTMEVRAPVPASAPAAGDLSQAVEQDLFRPDRKRPAMRFRLPGEPLPGSTPAGPPESRVRLIGTALLPPGGGFAMCQVGDDPPRVVRLGERLGDLVLREVVQGRAVFVSPGGGRLELKVPRGGT